MDEIFSLADKLGPFKVIHVQESSIGLRGILVIDNVSRGPSVGGVRMATDVTLQECARLARAMTFKNAAADLPFGGGKAVLAGDPRMPDEQKEVLVRGFCRSLEEVEQYIFAPDMGTNEESMGWIKDEIGRVVGLPRVLGGIPLDEIGATGWGVKQAIDIAQDYCDVDITSARVVIQGFGAVGQNAARFLAEGGATIVAVSDSLGTLFDPDGLDVKSLIQLKAEGGSVTDADRGDKKDRDAIVDIECDIWIPAARPDVIGEHNVDRLRTRLVVQGANIPVTLAAETRLHQKGVLCIPDFIANAGGVICAALEYQGAPESSVFAVIEEKIRRNTRQVLDNARRDGSLPRDAALSLAKSRVEHAMSFRRWKTF